MVLVLDVSRPVLITALHDAALPTCELSLLGDAVREQCRWQRLWPLARRQDLASRATDPLLSVFPIRRPNLRPGLRVVAARAFMHGWAGREAPRNICCMVSELTLPDPVAGGASRPCALGEQSRNEV